MSNDDGRSDSDITTWISLNVRIALPVLSWGPLWAALCGALASGAIQGNMSQFPRLFLVLLVADPLLANLCHLLFDCDWPIGSRLQGQCQGANRPVVALPYTDEGAPAYHLALLLSRIVGWWQDSLRAPAKLMVSSALFESGCLVALAFALGPPVPWAVGLGFVLLGLGLIARFRGSEWVLVPRSLVEVVVPFGIGYMAFGSLSFVPVGLMAFYALVYGASLRVLATGVGRTVWIIVGALVGLTGWLLFTRHPVSGTVVGLLSLFPLWLSLTSARGPVDARWYLRRINLFMLAITLASAMAAVLA